MIEDALREEEAVLDQVESSCLCQSTCSCSTMSLHH